MRFSKTWKSRRKIEEQERRSRHKIMKRALFIHLVAATMLTLGWTYPGSAQEDRFNMSIEMAYAPEIRSNLNERFQQFDLEGSYEDTHELNDAWLGMPVRDAKGNNVGYVEDAFLDHDGYLSELLVVMNGSGIAVYVDHKHVDYTEIAVLVDLPAREIARLEQEESIGAQLQ